MIRQIKVLQFSVWEHRNHWLHYKILVLYEKEEQEVNKSTCFGFAIALKEITENRIFL